MNRQFRGEKGGWGRMTAPPKKNDEIAEGEKDQEKEKEENESDTNDETPTEEDKK